ncbi:MAG: hypothetical protein EON58_09005 [Alphaproteobacteria bacterium]|nr:MAG: hypothetical protein EON58_09005 [Alphaproteobacteria bacterium]
MLKEQRLEAERQKAKAEAAEKRRVKAAREQEILRRQRARLINLEAWERAQRLRLPVQAVENGQSNSSEKAAWLEWAKAQIYLLDPIESGLSDLLNLKVELESYFSGCSFWNKAPDDWWSIESE